MGFDELVAFVNGRALTHPKPKRHDLAAQLSLAPSIQASFDAGDEPWSASRLRSELFDALAAAGLRCVDLLRAWDKGTKGGESGIALSVSSDNLISNKEFLVAMKKLCGGDSMCAATAATAGDKVPLGSDELWYGMVRDAAVAAFRKMDASGDKSISVQEMQRWLDPHAKLLNVTKNANAGATSPGKRRRSITLSQALVTENQVAGYSPTKLSTRIAAVRAFAPEPDPMTKSRRTRRSALAPMNGGGPLAPNCVRERVWSTRRSESKGRLGPSSSTAL